MTDRKRLGGMFAGPGEYVPDALDRAILAVLPEEGAKIGKYLPDGMPVKRLRQQVDPVVTTGIYSARLKAMRASGYVVPVKLSGGKNAGQGWQRTKKGRLAAGVKESATG